MNRTYYISENDITNYKNKLNEDTKIYDVDIIDPKFDDLMGKFKDNFTKLMNYLEDEKNNNFPLEENILKDDFFSPDEEQTIKKDIESLSNNIINKIKVNNTLYLNDIENQIQDLLNNNKEKLNSLFLNINVLFQMPP